ncbi:hypothetical protein, partial [Microbacterium sp. BF1]|uniref:hypothetical protein n=1 Tax=Microbacterium sp. BF1 TaxID=2821146 RepID=UPI002119F583
MDKAATLTWLRRISGDIASVTIKRLEDTLPWYADMPPARRSAVGLVAQAGITSFIQWYEDPTSTPWIAADIFAAAPRELLRSVSLQQTLQLIRVTVEVTEERVAGRGNDLREAILLYSRDVAFAAADVYARAAEARGLWDARLEALVVDSILTGEADEELPSRIAALGWHGHGEVAVLVGTTPPQFDVDLVRRTARKLAVDVLIGVQGSRLVLVLGRARVEGQEVEEEELGFQEIAARLEPSFGPGYVVHEQLARRGLQGAPVVEVAPEGGDQVGGVRLQGAEDALDQRLLRQRVSGECALWQQIVGLDRMGCAAPSSRTTPTTTSGTSSAVATTTARSTPRSRQRPSTRA